MLLTHTDLRDLVAAGVILGVPRSHINGASIDVTLGSRLWIEAPPRGLETVVDLMAKGGPHLEPVDLLACHYYDLAPGQFCLAATAETFYLPDNIAAEFKLKSSLARAGLNHALAGFADPGWTGSVLTLELTNTLRWHSLRLRPGMKAGQCIFFKGNPVPQHASYATRGQYNHDRAAQPSKGVQ